jgi:hypothetical protein
MFYLCSYIAQVLLTVKYRFVIDGLFIFALGLGHARRSMSVCNMGWKRGKKTAPRAGLEDVRNWLAVVNSLSYERFTLQNARSG